MRSRTSPWLPILALVVLLLATLACGSSTTQELSEAAKQPTDAVSTSKTAPEETKSVGNTQIPATSEATEPTATPSLVEPAPIPTTEPEAIQIAEQGFGQDGREIGYAFILENPNDGLAVEDSQYQIAAYDSAGIVVETNSGYVEVILPGERLGVGGTLYVDEGVTVDKLEVQLREGRTVVSEPIPSFEVKAVSYTASEYFSYATGVVTNPFDRTITNLRVCGVARGSDGKIVGGGLTYLNFIPASAETGVKVNITSAGDVITIEVFPTLSGLSSITEGAELPTNSKELALVKYGFGQDEGQVGVGLIVENPNEGFSVENSQYRVTAYDAEGTVAAVEEGYVEVLLPQQTLGIGGNLYLDQGMNIEHIEVQVLSGDYQETTATPFFTAENVAYIEGDYSSKVTGQIVSPYAKDVTNVRVGAIAYDSAGEIIGGGFTFLDFIPANGKAAIEVSVHTAEKPATVELYAAVSGLSVIE